MKSYRCNSCLNKISNFSKSKGFFSWGLMVAVMWTDEYFKQPSCESFTAKERKAHECSYACSFQFYFWGHPPDFYIYSVLHIWSLDKWNLDVRSVLPFFRTMYKPRCTFKTQKATVLSKGWVLHFNFNWYPLHKQIFLCYMCGCNERPKLQSR